MECIFNGTTVMIGQLQQVEIKPFLFIPHAHAGAADIRHGARDVEEMLEEFRRHIFVGMVVQCQFQGDTHHVQREHGHPTGAVGLVEMPAFRQRRATIEDPDIVQPEETALEDIPPLCVLAVHPPGEVEQQLHEDAFQEEQIALTAGAFAVDLIDAPAPPRPAPGD